MWWIIFDSTTGRPLSETSVEPRGLPSGMEVKSFTSRMRKDQMWDDLQRTFVDRPAPVFVDRLEDVKADPRLTGIWQKLTPGEVTTLEEVFVSLLGSKRMRRDDEKIGIDTGRR